MNFVGFILSAAVGLAVLVFVTSALHLIEPVWWGGKALWMPALAVTVLALTSPIAYFFSKWWFSRRPARYSGMAIGGIVGLTLSLIVMPLSLVASFPLHRTVIAPVLEAAGVQDIIVSILTSASIVYIVLSIAVLGAVFHATS